MTLRLSEAIRLGAMLKPQGFGWFNTDDGGTCAMGAAMQAAGHIRDWPVVKKSPAACPACPLVRVSDNTHNATGAMIVHLNDDHRWTRERIADWVATLEAQDSAPTEDAASPPVEALHVADA
jgi:hypothetical protein